MCRAHEHVADNPQDTDRDDASHHQIDVHVALSAHHHRADAAIGGDDLGDDEIGPTDGEHLAHRRDDPGQARRDDHGRQNLAAAGAEGARGVDQLAARTASRP